jgi:hypothetical protein
MEIVLSTEAAEFTPDPVAVVVDMARPHPIVRFERPGAMILRAPGSATV